MAGPLRGPHSYVRSCSTEVERSLGTGCSSVFRQAGGPQPLVCRKLLWMGQRVKVEPEMPVALVRPGLLLPWVSNLVWTLFGF